MSVPVNVPNHFAHQRPREVELEVVTKVPAVETTIRIDRADLNKALESVVYQALGVNVLPVGTKWDWSFDQTHDEVHGLILTVTRPTGETP